MKEKGEQELLDMVEKPPVEEAPSRMAVLGRYIITPEIFEILERTDPGAGGEIQLDSVNSFAQIFLLEIYAGVSAFL